MTAEEHLDIVMASYDLLGDVFDEFKFDGLTVKGSRVILRIKSHLIAHIHEGGFVYEMF